ncbi:MAG: hypothetical protein KY410_07120 [Proteobacteria bacterium]|nr:hypothetical protein [Pseudomonadota bacterium]
MYNRAIMVCFIAHLVLAGFPEAVESAEPAESDESGKLLTASEIEQRCRQFIRDPEEAESEACVAFMQGFLAGLDAGRNTGRRDVVPQGSGFTDRALRTRAGGSLQRFQTLQGDEYCIPENVSGVEVVQRVTAYLGAFMSERSTDENSIELIHYALVQSYPCDKD